MAVSTEPEAPDLPDELVAAPPGAWRDHAVLEGVQIADPLDPAPHARGVAVYQSRVAGRAIAASKLPVLRLTDCLFDRADLAGSTWADARIVRVRFEGCRLTGFDARGGELRDVLFSECKLPDAFFVESSLDRVTIKDCQMPNLDLTAAAIGRLAIRSCDATGLRLAGARIEHLDLRGSVIDGLIIDAAAVRRLTIDPAQAPALAAALGATVKSDE